jgi:hypothetical protein
LKDSPQEIGFVIGAIVAFLWLLWAGGRTTGSSGGGNLIFLLLGVGIGWGLGWLVGRWF